MTLRPHVLDGTLLPRPPARLAGQETQAPLRGGPWLARAHSARNAASFHWAGDRPATAASAPFQTLPRPTTGSSHWTLRLPEGPFTPIGPADRYSAFTLWPPPHLPVGPAAWTQVLHVSVKLPVWKTGALLPG